MLMDGRCRKIDVVKCMCVCVLLLPCVVGGSVLTVGPQGSIAEQLLGGNTASPLIRMPLS